MRTPSSALRLALVGLLVTLAAGCTADSPTDTSELTIADFAGTWVCESFFVVAKDDPATKFDMITMGVSLSWSVTPSGTFTGSAVVPAVDFGVGPSITVPMSGVLRLVSTETMRIDFVPEFPPMFTTFIGSFTLAGDALTVNDDEATYDFDGDGVVEQATLRATLRRAP